MHPNVVLIEQVLRHEPKLIKEKLVETDVDFLQARQVVCQSPGHCAVGALLFYGGLTDDEIFDLDSDPSEWVCHPDEGDEEPKNPSHLKAMGILFHRYQLSQRLVENIVATNDAVDDLTVIEKIVRNLQDSEVNRYCLGSTVNPDTLPAPLYP